MPKDEEPISKVRVQLDLPPKSMARLNALKEATEAGSNAEVIRNALRLYEAMIKEVQDGNEFMVRRPDGTIGPIKIFAG